jgi:hypothetical protein
MSKLDRAEFIKQFLPFDFVGLWFRTTTVKTGGSFRCTEELVEFEIGTYGRGKRWRYPIGLILLSRLRRVAKAEDCGRSMSNP